MDRTWCHRRPQRDPFHIVSPIMKTATLLAAAVAALPALLSTPGAVAAQATDLAGQTLGRAYWHVFIAYAAAWVLVFGWTVAIARRLARVERRLERGSEDPER